MIAVDELSFAVPAGWAVARLDNWCDIAAGMTKGRKLAGRGTVTLPYLRVANVKAGYLLLDEVKTIGVPSDEVARYSLRPGDVLLTEGGDWDKLGRSAIWSGEIDPCLHQNHIFRARPLTDGVLPEWISLFTNSEEGRQYFQSKAKRTTNLASINMTELRSTPLPMPPAEEQRRILTRVKELLGMCEELEAQQATKTCARITLTSAALHRFSRVDFAPELRGVLAAFASNVDIHLAPGDGDLAALKLLRQTILDLAVRGRLTHHDPSDGLATDLVKEIAGERDRLVEAKEIRKPKKYLSIDDADVPFVLPPGWAWTPLGRLVLSADSGWSPVCLPSRREDDSQWGVLKVSAVSWGEFRADEHKQLTPGLSPRPQIEVQDGDFLMSRANTAQLVGRSVVATDPPPRLMLSDKHVRLRFLDRTSAEYVNLVNNSSSAREYYAAVATGTSDSMRNITREQILALPIPVPPLAEQKRIVNVVRALHAHCDKLELQLLDAQARRRGLSESAATHVTAGKL